MQNKFSKPFGDAGHYVCVGDKIKTTLPDGSTAIAYIECDDSADRPDEMDSGFWPSNDKDAAGYVPAKDFDKEQKRAEEVMRAWKNDEWFYCGVVLRIEREDGFVKDHAASLWGIDCNYPGSDNSYLLEVANDLLDEYLHEQETAAK
jgi:hypothetical protein